MTNFKSNNFLLGVVSTLLLVVLVGGGWYIFTQQRSPQSATNQLATNNEPQPETGTTAATNTPATTTPGSTSIDPTLPAPQTLNLQVNHANGTTARLTGITFTDDHMTADLTVTNGYRSAIRLNSNHEQITLAINIT